MQTIQTFTPVPAKPPTDFQVRMQMWTFAASMLVQIITLVLSSVAVSKENLPPVLVLVLWLEVSVQLVEIVWYGTVVACIGEVDVSRRYIDWSLTTPAMLVSLLFFVRYEHTNALALSDLANEASEIVAIVCIVLLDWGMLVVGWAYEVVATKGSPPSSSVDISAFLVVLLATTAFPLVTVLKLTLGSDAEIYVATAIVSVLDAPKQCFGESWTGLYFGFVPFVGAFVPTAVTLGQFYTPWALLSVLLTFFTWLLYGVVAMIELPIYRNAAYNVLDIVSKNVVGIVVSVVALTYDPAAAAA